MEFAVLNWYVENITDSYSFYSDTSQLCVDRSNLSFIKNDFIPYYYTLHQNNPNPFNPVTILRYDLPEDAMVNITIYDMMGRNIKTLINQTQDPGYKSIIWDATNDQGQLVSAGIYLYQIQAGEYISTKKMVLLK